MRLTKTVRNGKERNAEQTREAILRAAVAEFALEGFAGARTDAIARAAHVNKALLYYYFHDKETLYGAVLDHAFGSIYPRLVAVLESDLPCREKILAYAGTHFDALASNPRFCRLVHAEMGRAGREGSPHLLHLGKKYLAKLAPQVQGVIREGMAAGEFRAVDPVHFALSIAALNVFYFVAAPMFRVITGQDPFAPERIAARRAAVLDLLSHALFVPAEAGDQPSTRAKAHDFVPLDAALKGRSSTARSSTARSSTARSSTARSSTAGSSAGKKVKAL